MPGMTIPAGTKKRFDAFKQRERCTSAVAIEMLLAHFMLFETLQRENVLLRDENARLKAEQGD